MPLEESEPSIESEDQEDEIHDEDEATIEEVDNETPQTPKTKKELVDDWSHLNAQPSLWMR